MYIGQYNLDSIKLNGKFQLTLCMLLLLSADFISFKKLTFWKNSFRNTIRVSKGLDPDQDRYSVGPDLGQTVCKGYQ